MRQNIEGKCRNILLDNIDDFPEHPFKVIDNEEMQDMVDSIKTNGVLVPAIVRQKEDGRYEMISGHRRKFASRLAGLETIPCVVRDYTDDEATIMMVDSNKQREIILPSEKAFAYKMKLEAQKQQGKRNDLTSSQVATKLKGTADKIGAEFNESRDTVYRYVRLTNLIPELLKLVDEERIAFSPAVEISYLKEDEQYVLHNIYEYDDVTPNQSQAKHLKMLSQEGKLTAEKIEELMEKPKANQIEKLKLNYERIRKILPSYVKTEQQAEDFIEKCIKEHNAREEKKREYAR